jgi:hypothetical protein
LKVNGVWRAFHLPQNQRAGAAMSEKPFLQHPKRWIRGAVFFCRLFQI